MMDGCLVNKHYDLKKLPDKKNIIQLCNIDNNSNING